MRKPAIATGAIIGLLLTAPLMSLLYLVNQLSGLAFVPFEFFNWLRDRLPGRVVIGGIEMLSKTLTFLGLSVREASKPAEFITVLGMFLALGVLAGLVFFAVMRWVKAGSGLRGGLTLGAGVGLALMTLVLGTGKDVVGRIPDALWALVTFLGWGVTIGWAYQKLAGGPIPPSEDVLSVQQLGRRHFLIRVGAASAAFTVIGSGAGSYLATRSRSPQESAAVGEQPTQPATSTPVSLPNANASVVPAPGTRPEYTPLPEHYRIDINLTPPVIDGATWSLPVTGMVERELSLTLDDLHNNYEPMHQYITLSCISNGIGGDLISTTRWTGVSVQKILRDAGVKTGAKYLELQSIDGFYEMVDLSTIAEDPRIMFTYAWDGVPLLPEHGYPLRIYIPDRYGMKQPKWIVNAALVSIYKEGYWVQRGWDEAALVKATSVIDTVAVDDAYTSTGGDKMIPMGGIAYAGARGISEVEVRVDNGAWIKAQLRTPLSDTTWVIWRYDWPFRAGEHIFYVRCRDGTGRPQIERRADTFPSGATGIHSK